jgi:hypothetical protein
VYKESPGNNPQRFQDGTALPSALLKPTFGWNGTTAEITAGWNAGPFMVVHRDHGYSDGWSTPAFGTANAQALTNGANLPVVLSINCSSGAYDYDETSFSGEALVSPNGGAVGVFGDTRDSPTNHNSIMALGFVDGMLPSVLEGEGPTTKQRTGDALITGKLRLVGISPPAGDGNTRNELYLWHYYGDPSMQMWGGGHPPFKFDIAQIKAVYKYVPTPTPDPPPYQVEVTLPTELIGQPISLLRKGEVVGKALIGDGGVATIPASFGDGSVLPGDLQVAIEPDGGPAVQAPVSDVPNGTSALTQTCPAGGQVGVPLTVSGKLTGAPAGAKVDVTFVAPTLQTLIAVPPIVVSATVDAQGNWSATVTPKDGEAGNWTVSSAYAGDATHNGSKAGPCTVAVTRQTTTLTQDCPADASFQNPPLTVTGQLKGAPAGSVVDVTFSGRNANGGPIRTVVQHPTTDAQGNWSASLAIVRQDQGEWTITSAYAGDGTYTPSNAGPCTVTVGS